MTVARTVEEQMEGLQKEVFFAPSGEECGS